MGRLFLAIALTMLLLGLLDYLKDEADIIVGRIQEMQQPDYQAYTKEK